MEGTRAEAVLQGFHPHSYMQGEPLCYFKRVSGSFLCFKSRCRGVEAGYPLSKQVLVSRVLL